MKARNLFFILPAICSIVILTIESCKKKDEVIQYEGLLLVSTSNPIPVRNYKLDIYQPGNGGIPFPITSSSASAEAYTDDAGRYNFSFKPGNSTFLIFRGTNSSPIDVRGSGNGYPSTYFMKLSNDIKTYYLYKKVDTAILAVNNFKKIEASDSIMITYLTNNGNTVKYKTGIIIDSNAQKTVFDTIYNPIFTFFDNQSKRYEPNIDVKIKKQSATNFRQINNTSYDSIGVGDERRREFLFWHRN